MVFSINGVWAGVVTLRWTENPFNLVRFQEIPHIILAVRLTVRPRILYIRYDSSTLSLPTKLGVRQSWRAGADCKSAAEWLSRFESYRSHKIQ